MKLPIANLQPKKWWHWVTLLIIVILQSIPTLVSVVDSYKLNVPYSKVAIANEQQKLWQKNFECIKYVCGWWKCQVIFGDVFSVQWSDEKVSRCTWPR